MAIRAEGMWRSSRKSKENDEWDGATGRLSERLLPAAEGAWQEAMKKQFLLEMADGTLSPERFRYYMLIDYLYLTEYIKTLRIIEERSGEPEIKSFLQNTIGATEEELGRVHFPNMMQLGITEEVISKTSLPQEAEETIEIEYICFPPNEACTPKSMRERARYASECSIEKKRYCHH